MGPRNAGNPPPCFSTPPRPPDLDEVRRKRIQIARAQAAEQAAAWRRELENTMASFQSELLNELRQFRLELIAQVMEPSGPTSSVPIISLPVTQSVSSGLQLGTIDSYKPHQQLYMMSNPPPSPAAVDQHQPPVYNVIQKLTSLPAHTDRVVTPPPLAQFTSSPLPLLDGAPPRIHPPKIHSSRLQISSPPLEQPTTKPPLLDGAVSTQPNNSPASFFSVSGTNPSVSNPFNCHKDDCGGMGFVFGANDIDEKLENGESVEKRAEVTSGDGRGFSELECVIAKRDEGGIVEDKEQLINGMLEFHALQLFDKMPNSEGLCNARRTGFCNARRTIITSMSIPDKGGGLTTHRDIVDASNCIRDKEAVAVALAKSPNSIQEALSTLPSLYICDAGLSENDVNTDWLKLDSEMAIYSNDAQSEAKRVQGFIRCLQLCHCEIKKNKPFCKEAFDGLGGLTPTSLSRVLTRLKLNFRDVRRAFESIMSCLLELYHNCLNGKVGEENWPSAEGIEKMNRDANNWFDKWLRSETRLCGFQDATLREIFDAIHVNIEAYFQLPDKKIITDKLDCKPFLVPDDLNSEDKVFIIVLPQRTVLGEFQTFFIKYVVWSNDVESISLLNRHAKIIASKRLVHQCTLHETVRVKYGGWDDNGVFIYSTMNHIKNYLPNDDSGIIIMLEVTVYITKVFANIILCLDRDGKNMIIVIDATEYIFELFLLKKKYDNVMSIIRNSQLCGQAMIAYMQLWGTKFITLNFAFTVCVVYALMGQTECAESLSSLLGVCAKGCGEFDVKEHSHGFGDKENVVKQAVFNENLNISQSSHLSGGTVVYSDMHDWEASLGLDVSSRKPMIASMPVKGEANMFLSKIKMFIKMFKNQSAKVSLMANPIATAQSYSYRKINCSGLDTLTYSNGSDFARSCGSTLSYICYLVGNLSHKCQAVQLQNQRQKQNSALEENKRSFFLSLRILFPRFISALVKGDQQLQFFLTSVIVFVMGRAFTSLELLQNECQIDRANVKAIVASAIIQLHLNEATELILSKGMRVCYKSTKFLDDQVIFTGFSYGGLFKLVASEYFSCSMGPGIAGDIGVYGYRPSVLMNMLASWLYVSLRYCFPSAISMVTTFLLSVALVMCVTACGVMKTIEKAHIDEYAEKAKKKQLDIFLGLVEKELYLTMLQYGISDVGKGFIYDILCLQLLRDLVRKMLQTWTWENTKAVQTHMTVISFLCFSMVIIKVDDVLEFSSRDKELIKENSTYESVTATRVHLDQFKALVRGVQILTQNVKLEDKFLLRGLHCYENRLK